MRRGAQQHLAFLERLAHQVEFIMFQIAQTAVHELGTGRGGMRGKIVALDQQHFQPPARRIACDSDAIDAAADDGQIIHGRCHKVPGDLRNAAMQYRRLSLAFSIRAFSVI